MTTTAGVAPRGSVLGNPVRRREDPLLLTGQGRYVDDVRLDDALFALFVRSTVAHARIGRIDTAEAAAMPGVVAVHIDESLGLPARKFFPPLPDAFNRPHLARDAVRFVGEPVAVVVAETLAQAADAAEAVLVDYEPLSALVDVEAAARDEVVLFPEAGTNHCYQVAYGNEGDALEGYRGAGRPEAAELVERAMDMLASRLRMDPVELRRRKFIAADAFPLKTVAGAPYDSREYARALDRALGIAGYDALRREQARQSGPWRPGPGPASPTMQMRRATASGCSSARRTAGPGTLPGSPAPPAPSSR